MILLFFIFLCLANNTYRVNGSKDEDLELQRQLKFINKPPIKSVLTEFGYIVDCIDINKQLAFDHPLLKNHRIQRKPSFKSAVSKSNLNGSLKKVPKIGLEKNTCPKGTVPIRRTTREDLIRLNSKSNNSDNLDTSVAAVYMDSSLLKAYFGVRGTLSIYNPRVEKDQTSAAQIWVENGAPNEINAIYLGWQVSPQLYGDDSTYVYSQWTSDNFKSTGCYNVRCPGFVQTDKQVYLGARVDHTSIYGGVQAEFIFSIARDPISKNWWLIIENKKIGYFPAALFSNLKAANLVGWGGKTTTPMGRPSPQMGSGYFPDDNFVHADYFRHIAYKDDSENYFGPDESVTISSSNNDRCFGVKYYGQLDAEKGYSLLFGGPGGNCSN